LLVGLVHTQRVHAQALDLLAQASVLRAHVLPVEVRGPQPEGAAMDLVEADLHGGGDESDGVGGAQTVATSLQREEEQAHCADGSQQRERANLHSSDPRKGGGRTRPGSPPSSTSRARRALSQRRAPRTRV